MIWLALILTVCLVGLPFLLFIAGACVLARRADDTADQIARQIANGEAAQPAADTDYCGWVETDPADFECGAPPALHVPAGRFDAPAGGGDPVMPAAGTIPNARPGGGPRFSLHADRNS